jgi:hypothetical protein
MNIEDILQALPSKEDIVRAAGVGNRASASADHMLSVLGLFGAGIFVGASLALLFAPKPGQQIREEIAEKVGELRGQLHAHASPEAVSGNGPNA